MYRHLRIYKWPLFYCQRETSFQNIPISQSPKRFVCLSDYGNNIQAKDINKIMWRRNVFLNYNLMRSSFLGDAIIERMKEINKINENDY